MARVKLSLTCIREPSCVVSFEPEGAQHELVAGDIFHVEIVGSGSGEVEIVHRPHGLSVWAWGGAETTVHNKAGNRLSV